MLVLAVAGCATAPVHDDNLDRINKGMASEQADAPDGLPMGEAPPLAPPDPYSPYTSYTRRGRGYRHLTPYESDVYTGNVTVPNVVTGTTPPVPYQPPPMPVPATPPAQ
jgi:hypothetical protein